MLPRIYDPDASVGVRHDSLVDARIEAETAEYQLRQMHVMLDGMADTREGIWTEDQMSELRDMQARISTLLNAIETTVQDTEDELGRVHEELRDE